MFNFTGLNADLAQAAAELIALRPDLEQSILKSLQSLRTKPSAANMSPAEIRAVLDNWDSQDDCVVYIGRFYEPTSYDIAFLHGIRVRP
jgi:hypothetical protein